MAEMWILYTGFFWFVVLCAVGTRAGTLPAQVYCFDRPTVYADGALVGSNTGTDHHWTGEVADDTKLLAVKCYNVNSDLDNSAGYCGFLAHVVGILASDMHPANWKCTESISESDNDRWYGLDFDDSDWKMPSGSGSNEGSYKPTVKYDAVIQTDAVYVSSIPKPFEFLTTGSSSGDLEAVYCRGKTGMVIFIQCSALCAVLQGPGTSSSTYGVISNDAWSHTFPRTTRVLGISVQSVSDQPYIAIRGPFGIRSSTEWRCISDGDLFKETREDPTDRNDSRWQTAVDQGPILLSDEVQGATPIWATGNKFVCVFDVECGCEHKCSVSGDDFTCLCHDGYSLNDDNRTCTDVNECDHTQCDHQCVNLPGSYECQCFDGYVLDVNNAVTVNGVQICVDDDECQRSNGFCDHVCENTAGSYRCLCNQGFVLLNDQRTCVDMSRPPGITEVFPLFGPQSGGTRLTVRVVHIVPVESISVLVKLGDLDCKTLNWTKDEIVALTPAINDGSVANLYLNKETDISVHLAPNAFVANERFVYKPDPVLTKVYPLKALSSGGIRLTVEGNHLDSVARSILSVYMAYVDNDQIKTMLFKQLCIEVKYSRMICPTPRIDAPLRYYSNNSRVKRDIAQEKQYGSDSFEARVKRQANEIPAGRQFDIGFDFDGVKNYVRLKDTTGPIQEYAFINIVYTKPAIKQWDSDKDASDGAITIEGEGMARGCKDDDYTVTVGRGYCTKLVLSENAVTCNPPEDPPQKLENVADPRGHRVRLFIGVYKNFERRIGFLRYSERRKWHEEPTNIAALCAGVFILLLIILVPLCICWCRRRRRASPPKRTQLTISSSDQPPSDQPQAGTLKPVVTKQGARQRFNPYKMDYLTTTPTAPSVPKPGEYIYAADVGTG